MVSWLTGVQLHDHNCGMKCYRAEVFREMRLYGELHRFIPVLAAARGLQGRRDRDQPPAAASSATPSTASGASSRAFSTCSTVKFLTGFGQRPQHLLGTIGLLAFALGLLGMVYLTSIWFIRLWHPEGFEPLHERPLLDLLRRRAAAGRADDVDRLPGGADHRLSEP